MYQQQPPQWQPPRPRPRRPVPKWAWYIAGGWVAFIVVLVVLVAVFDPPKQDPDASASTPVRTSAPAASHSAKLATDTWPYQAVPVTARQLGKDWPFRDTTRGFVGCDASHPGAIIFNPGDGPYLAKPFALNGTALDWGYPDVPKKIWLPDPSIPDSEARMSVGPLQDLAPHRCEAG